jgi:hypothetical protein
MPLAEAFLFADDSLDAYDEKAAPLLRKRVLEFLDTVQPR